MVVDARVGKGEWCGCQGDVKKTSVAKRHTRATLWGTDVLCHSEVSGMGGRRPSWEGGLSQVSGKDGACSSRAELVTIARAGMWHGLPKPTLLGSEPLEVELGVREVLGDKSIWPRSWALPGLWG